VAAVNAIANAILTHAGRNGPALLCGGVLIGLVSPWLADAARPLSAIIGGAALTAWLLRRYAGNWVAANPNAMTGIAVLGQLLVAVAAMRGMREEIMAAPGQAALLLALAFLVNGGLQAIGTHLFAGIDYRRALTIGLVSGKRNITLIWAAAAPFLADRPGIELFLAMSVFLIFMLRAMTQRIFASLLERTRVLA
jgi:hypothetical protein